jgi:acyl carrier protein
LEYLGRQDAQVKVRGYRIELGEIEIVIGQYPLVRQAIVVAREDQPGDKRLVAYIVPASGAALDADKLRGYLREKLPNYMLPSAFVRMEAFPLTVNGKIDRKALPVPEMGTLGDQEYIAPRSQTEQTLSKIWMDVLGIPRVSMEDNFFDVGGNSLSAIRVMARIQDKFKIAVPVRRIFELSRLSELAVYVEFGLLSQKQSLGSKEGTSEQEEFVL